MWLILGLSSGLFHALMSMVSKKSMGKTDEYISSFAYTFFALPFFFLALFWLDWTNTLNFTFWYATLITATLKIISLYFFMKALKISEFSLVIPLLTFTPLFLIFTSMIMLGEFPSSMGILGIITIVLGVYILNLKERKQLLEPLKSLFRNRGAQLMLLVAFIHSISSNFDKIAIQSSNPITFLIISNALIASAFLFFIHTKSKIGFPGIKTNFKFLVPIGMLSAATLLCQMTAINMALVPYVISLKRTSALFGVILGFLVFKEKNIKPKLLGASLMVLGVFLISMS